MKKAVPPDRDHLSGGTVYERVFVSLLPVDRLQVPVQQGQQGVFPMVKYAGPAGGAEDPGDGGHPGPRLLLLQRPAAPKSRQVGVKGGNVLFHYFVSVSLKSPSRSETWT